MIRLYVRVEAFESPLIDPVERARAFDVPEILKVVELHIDGDGEILTADYLRRIPLSAIESVINANQTAFEIYGKFEGGYIPLDIARQLSHFEGLPKNKSKSKRKIDAPIPSISTVRRVAINRPKDGRLSDEFLSRVAQFYQVSVSLSERPILTLSESGKVPRDTAARWVKLARERGFLSSPNMERDSNDG